MSKVIDQKVNATLPPHAAIVMVPGEFVAPIFFAAVGLVAKAAHGVNSAAVKLFNGGTHTDSRELFVVPQFAGVNATSAHVTDALKRW